MSKCDNHSTCISHKCIYGIVKVKVNYMFSSFGKFVRDNSLYTTRTRAYNNISKLTFSTLYKNIKNTSRACVCVIVLVSVGSLN